MIWLTVEAQDLANTRFAISPIAETVGAMLTLAGPREPWLARWADAHRGAFAGVAQGSAAEPRPAEPAVHQLAGAHLLLMPSSFGCTWLCIDAPNAYALVYPARGAAVPPPVPTPAGLDRLIGRSRATLPAPWTTRPARASSSPHWT